MNDKSERQIEKIIVIATIIIFILLLFLKTADSRILQEIKPSLAGLSAGCADERAGQAVSQESIFQEEQILLLPKQTKILSWILRQSCFLVDKLLSATCGSMCKFPMKAGRLLRIFSWRSFIGAILIPLPNIASGILYSRTAGNKHARLRQSHRHLQNRFIGGRNNQNCYFNYLLNVIPLTVDFSHYDSTPAFSAKQYVEPAYLNPALKMKAITLKLKPRPRSNGRFDECFR